MARRIRFQIPASTYHVMLRGNDGQSIFFSEGDKVKMCLLIQQGIERFDHTIEAFCFMSNHIHLAIRVFDISISRIVHHLAFRYAQFVNMKYKRIGHLYQGRFKSILVDDATYLKELIRYIHLNPVRAHMVSDPQHYLWSSHKAYMGLNEFVWLSKDRVLQRFYQEGENAVANYERYILKGMGITEEVDFKIGCSEGMLGDKQFVDEVLTVVGSKQSRQIELHDLITKVCEQYNLTQEELCRTGKHPKPSEARAFLTLIVRELNCFSIERLAKILNRDSTTLIKAANRLESKSNRDATFEKRMITIHNWLEMSV